MREAVFGLRRRHPELSAARPMVGWQAVAVGLVPGLFIGGFVVLPGLTTALLLALLTIPFFAVVLVRMIALFEVLAQRATAAPLTPATDDATLPTYSVLVPLFNEPEVLGDLIACLGHLDYPTDKLDIVLVLEEADLATKAALLALALPATMRTIVVPDSQPRTKPKALNYAMQFSDSDYVVVYDAEDRPDPDQLRRAVAAFRSAPADIACVQARLNLYNPHASWFAKQFTVEYSALFDAVLPALERLGLPVPLGGTSNHFPRVLLVEIGGWDPFNVTEDADLGVRLARLGWRTTILASTTWEEAPVHWQQWKPQRTRWLKGWMQTYLVHTRRPWQLMRDLGVLKTLGFHAFLGGLILSTLVHPWFYVVMAWNFLADHDLALPAFEAAPWLSWITGGNLLLGYLSAMAVGVIAARRRWHGLVPAALQMPLYWMLISFAAYRALWQLIRNPYLWEKTTHGLAKSETAKAGPRRRRS